MTIGEHIAQANSFVNDSLALQQQGSGMLAAEAVWGAVLQAVGALSHTLGTDDQRHPLRSRAIFALFEQHNLLVAFRGEFEDARDELHNHFYTGQLSAAALAESIEAGRGFVRRLLALAGA